MNTRSNHKSPNPQGKGLSPILGQWQQFQPEIAEQKSDGRLFADYFTSLLILSAEFRFKPVVGQRYYLYIKNRRWTLSLVEPQRWGSIPVGDCLGRCELHRDMTWSLLPSDNYFACESIRQGLQSFYEQFVEHLDCQESLQDKLPFYVAQLPFYQRMAAAGLAQSIKQSANQKQRLQAPCSDWLSSQPQGNPLLPKL